MIYLLIAIIYLVLFLTISSLIEWKAGKFLSLMTITAIAVSLVFYLFNNPFEFFQNPPVSVNYFVGVLGFLAILYAVGSIRVISQGSEALVERVGRYHRKLKPGLNFIVPFLDYIVLKDSVIEKILAVGKKAVTTKDNIILDVDAVIYWRILEIELTYYGIEDIEQALAEIVITGLRSEIGKMAFEKVSSSRDELNKTLRAQLDEATEPWGVIVTRVEVQEITLLENLSERNIVSIPFPEGIDWDAFKHSLIRVVTENDDIELSVQGIEKNNDGVMVIKVKVPENADKDKILVDFGKFYGVAEKMIEAKYRAELKGRDEQIEIYRRNSASMERIVEMMSSRPIGLEPFTLEVNAIAGSKDVNNTSDSSQNINVGRDLNLSGSTLNLGEVNGAITNTINQIPASHPGQIRIKELLSEMQQMLNAADEAILPAQDKVDALEQLKVLAEATQRPEEDKKTIGGRAIRFLQRIVDAIPTSLPVASSLVAEMNKLIPEIATLLGIL
jgi:hypothetical protein